MFAVVAGMLAVWLILSVINQVHADSLTWLHRFDCFGLMPNWKFFAPLPLNFDLVLLYRVSRGDPAGQRHFGDWSIVMTGYDRTAYDFLFNTSRRLNKAMADLYSFIIDLSKSFDADAICASSPAQALFALVRQEVNRSPGSARPRDSDWQIQFALVRVEGARSAVKGAFVFVSKPEPLQ